MQTKVWSSLPLNILRKEIKGSGISLSKLKLYDKDADISKCDIAFGLLPHKRQNGISARWIQLESVDHGGLKLPQRIVVTNMRGIFSRVIAESVLGSLLAYYRGVLDCAKEQPKRKWRRWPIRENSGSLTNKLVVILGGGSIAREIIPLLKPFQCQVIVYRREKKRLANAKIITTQTDLRKYIRKADVVINTLPDTKETKNFVSSRLLNSMSSDCVFVNCGRGSTVDEKALVKRLRQGKLQAAILDVTQQEPLKASSQLWKVPRLYLTQHTAGGIANEGTLKCQFFVQNLKRYLKGQRLLNRIRI